MQVKVNIEDSWFDINGDGLVYCEIGNCYGMQYNFEGSTEEYDRIKELCAEIGDKFRELRGIIHV